MKKITAYFLCLFALLGIAGAAERNEFQTAIEGESCVVHAYQSEPGIPLPSWFDSKPEPQPQWMVAILCQKSNIASFLSNEEVRALHVLPMTDEVVDKLRVGVAKRYEMTRQSAADNPWKGMTETLELGLVIDSARGKYLLYQTAAQLVGQPNKGRTYGALKFVDGKWKRGKTEFEIRNLATACDEFSKLKAAGKITARPLDALN
jgi:hypothetical protein